MRPPEDHTGGALNAISSERQIIAAFMDGTPEITQTLLVALPSAEPFLDPDCRTCMECILSLAKERQPIDDSTIRRRLKVGGRENLSTFVSTLVGNHSIFNGAQAQWHAGQVQTAFTRRSVSACLSAELKRVETEECDADELATYFEVSAKELRRHSGASHVKGLVSCLLPASQLASMAIPKRPRLLDKWLCEGDLGYVFAARGVGKTWLSMALPASISQGKALGLWEPGEFKTRVLYIDGEMPLELTQYRSRGLKLGEGDVEYLHHETLFNQLGSSLNIGVEAHRNAITDLLVSQAFKLVVLDNLSCLASGIDENKGDSYEPIKHWLLELRRRKVTVIVVHHAGRNSLMRGHSKREDDCSWILSLTDAKRAEEPGAKFITHFSKPSRNTGDSMPDLLWHFTTDEKANVSIHCERAETTEYEAFIQHVLDGVDTQSDIAEMMGKPRGTVCRWAQKAEREKRIKKSGGKVRPPDSIKRPRNYHEREDDDDRS